MKIAIDDLAQGWKRRHLWLTLARDDIRVRYQRTFLGPLWITLGFGFFILVISVLWTEIMRRDASVFVPWFAIGITTWQFITAAITEGTTTFITASGTIHNIPLPLSVHVYRSVMRHLINYLHNFLIVVIVLIIFPPPLTTATLLYFPGVLIVVSGAVAISIVLGILGARYRDFSYGVRMVMAPMFFLTPILWIPDMLSGPRVLLAELNPFAHFLAVVREPLLGREPTFVNYGVTLIVSLSLVLLALRLLGKHRWKVPYWIA